MESALASFWDVHKWTRSLRMSIAPANGGKQPCNFPMSPQAAGNDDDNGECAKSWRVHACSLLAAVMLPIEGAQLDMLQSSTAEVERGELPSVDGAAVSRETQSRWPSRSCSTLPVRRIARPTLDKSISVHDGSAAAAESDQSNEGSMRFRFRDQWALIKLLLAGKPASKFAQHKRQPYRRLSQFRRHSIIQQCMSRQAFPCDMLPCVRKAIAHACAHAPS